MVKKKTEKLIQEKFLKLLESKSIDEIDINMICKNLKIKRQTFYYHYKNIYDVILSFYFDDSIEYKSVKYDDIVQETVKKIYNIIMHFENKNIQTCFFCFGNFYQKKMHLKMHFLII